MNKWFLLFFVIAVTFGCSSTQSVNSQKYQINQLPQIVKCIETPEVFDTVPPVSRLNNRRLFSYAHAYNSIHFNGDSLVRDQIRYKNAEIARIAVQRLFPNIEIVEDLGFRNKTYKDVFLDLAMIRRLLPFLTTDSFDLGDQVSGNYLYGPHGEKELIAAENSIDNLTVKSDSELQLFIHIRSLVSEGAFSNKIFIYVFNTTTRRIPYYDEVEYYCDIRDQDALVKVLQYSLGKI
ncbi:MAG: hypothetical protein ABF295_10585 [Flavobacteriaceae bacterium]